MPKKINVAEDEYLHGYRIRLYPNKSEAKFIEKCINTNRFVYNWALEQEINQYKLYQSGLIPREESFIGLYDLDKRFTELRNSEGYEFLKDIPHNSGRSSIRRANNAYKRFFKHQNKYPRFKSKKNKDGMSYKTRADRMFFAGNRVRIEGLPKNDMIKIGYNPGFDKTTKVFNPVISKDKIGRYFLSFNIIAKKPLSYFDDNNIDFSEPIGIDLNKIKRCVLSNGKVYMAPNYSKTLKRIRRQEKINRRDNKRHHKLEITNPDFNVNTWSNKAKKRKIKLNKLYNRLHNINENFVEETTTEIIKTRPQAIVVEHIDVQGSILNKKYMARQMNFANFYNFKITLRDKADRYGIKFIEADQFYPSSQICSNCGVINKHPLGHKIYTCSCCGFSIDRDLNAALNLRNLAFA